MFWIRLAFLAFSLSTVSSSNAAGGNGATCNPSVTSWPGCALADVPIRESIKNTIHIPSGNYESPYIADVSNTEYILLGDMTADGTAITVKGNYVVINLNGYKITYNNTIPGEGVNIGDWNKHHIAIVNGSIIQGAAMSEGDQYGRGNNPVSTYNTELSGKRSASNMHIANLYVTYGGRDVGGIIISGVDELVEQNTVEDTYEFGTLKNRHQGIDAIGSGTTIGVVRNNTVINSRQRGIQVGSNSIVYGNHITTRSIATNAYGIFGYAKQNVKVYHNTILARGEHALGIGFASDGTNNIEIYGNYIDAMTTAIGNEYGGNPACFNDATPCGHFAVGFRTTWGGNNIDFHHNEIHISTDSAYRGTYSVNGSPVVVDAKGRGLMVGIKEGEEAVFSYNTIEVLDKDGTGKAYGIACTSNYSDGLFIIGNSVTSNITHLALGDDYSNCEGYPLFQGNTFIKENDFDDYSTISNQLSGYHNTTGRIVDNIYQSGTSVESINFHPSGAGSVSVYFGAVIDGSYQYSYRLHDNSGTSTTLLREEYEPVLTLEYAVPDEYNAPINVTLKDIILVLKISTGSSVDINDLNIVDINNDQHIGMAEALYGLQVLAGVIE